ncbi:MAG TPA: DUF5668 domain-containing protein [Candidatus Koribacter sp.]|jgi:hypothetical protein
MNRCQHHPRISAFTGLIIFLTGVLLLLGEFGFFHGFALWKIWPLALVVLGILKMVNARGIGHRIWGSVITTLGVLLLANYFAYFPYGIDRLWPLFIVGLGLALLVDGNRGFRHSTGDEELQ